MSQLQLVAESSNGKCSATASIRRLQTCQNCAATPVEIAPPPRAARPETSGVVRAAQTATLRRIPNVVRQNDDPGHILAAHAADRGLEILVNQLSDHVQCRPAEA